MKMNERESENRKSMNTRRATVMTEGDDTRRVFKAGELMKKEPHCCGSS